MKGEKITINGKDFDEHYVNTATQKNCNIKEGLESEEEILIKEELKSKNEEISSINHWVDARKNIPDSAMSELQITERNSKYARLLELLP